MDENKRCNGKCENCDINQRTYCAAQRAYYNQMDIAEIKAILMRKDNSPIETIITNESVVESQENSEIE